MKALGIVQGLAFILLAGYLGGYENGALDTAGFVVRAGILAAVMLIGQAVKMIIRRGRYAGNRGAYRDVQILRTDEGNYGYSRNGRTAGGRNGDGKLLLHRRYAEPFDEPDA